MRHPPDPRHVPLRLHAVRARAGGRPPAVGRQRKTLRRLFAKVDTTATGFQPDGRALLKRNGAVIGRGYMNDGHVQFAIDRRLPRGQQTMRAVYLGNHNVLRSYDIDTVRVVR